MAKVYVLGAGASYAVNSGAPLMPELLEKALEFSQDTSNVKTFLVDVFNMGEKLVPPFEDVLSLLDDRISNNMALSQIYSVDYLRQLRRRLIYIMGRFLEIKMAQRTNGHLVRTFLESLSSTDSIISLNYDLIIENSALNRGIVVNYNIPTNRSDKLVSDESVQHPSMYKLHGSLNWLHCPVCLVIESSNWKKWAVDALLKDVPCERCGTPLEPLLITPTFLKDYRNSFVSELWRKAHQEIQRADKIYFVGYSMPDADIMLRMFFTRAIFANKVIRGEKCHIYVIDKQQSDQNDLRTRYERLFGAVDFYKDGFDRYIETQLVAHHTENT